MNEEAFYFKNDSGRNLFGFLHRPKQNFSDCGFVFCSPTFEEKTKTYRILVNFARLLALNGYYVLRFDCQGEGDSDGDFDQADIKTRTADIKVAISKLKEKSNLTKISVLGLRLGASLAVLATKDMEIRSLILWEPVANIKNYLYDFLRGNLAHQLLIHKKILINRDQLVNKMLTGEKVNVDGWELTKSLWEQGELVNFFEDLSQTQKPVLLVSLSGNKINSELETIVSQKPNIVRETLKPEFTWNELKYYNPHPREIFEKTLKWIKINT